jgi:hypothetical protein
MTIAERVGKFLTDRSPASFCDDCLTGLLDLNQLQHTAG